MKKHNFPYLASGIGLFLILLVTNGSKVNDEGITLIPLLTLLIANEFAFFVTAIGAYLGVRHSIDAGIKPYYVAVTMVCAFMALFFLWMGVRLWPN